MANRSEETRMRKALGARAEYRHEAIAMLETSQPAQHSFDLGFGLHDAVVPVRVWEHTPVRVVLLTSSAPPSSWIL